MIGCWRRAGARRAAGRGAAGAGQQGCARTSARSPGRGRSRFGRVGGSGGSGGRNGGRNGVGGASEASWANVGDGGECNDEDGDGGERRAAAKGERWRRPRQTSLHGRREVRPRASRGARRGSRGHCGTASAAAPAQGTAQCSASAPAMQTPGPSERAAAFATSARRRRSLCPINGSSDMGFSPYHAPHARGLLNSQRQTDSKRRSTENRLLKGSCHACNTKDRMQKMQHVSPSAGGWLC